MTTTTTTYVTHQELRNLIKELREIPDDDRTLSVVIVNRDRLDDLLAATTRLLDQTEHPTRFPLVEHLADNVLNWYGFDRAYLYPFRPLALNVAVELHRNNATPDALTVEQIEDADKATGGRLREMWNAFNPATTPSSRKETETDNHGR